jgi:hypothetical protein
MQDSVPLNGEQIDPTRIMRRQYDGSLHALIRKIADPPPSI